MNAKLWPPILSRWLNNRKFHALTDISDTAGFAQEWLYWWNSVQPKWRQSMEKDCLPLPLSTRNKDDLVCLKKGGPSGLVTVLIGLKWWAPICDKDVRWLAAVEDVKACMEDFIGSGRKHKGEENERVGKKQRLG